VAWGQLETGRDSRSEAGAQGRPRTVLPLRPGALAYSIAEVTRDPYPDPHDSEGKNLVADLRAFESCLARSHWWNYAE